jgi:hypothetical protein
MDNYILNLSHLESKFCEMSVENSGIATLANLYDIENKDIIGIGSSSVQSPEKLNPII